VERQCKRTRTVDVARYATRTAIVSAANSGQSSKRLSCREVKLTGSTIVTRHISIFGDQVHCGMLAEC